MKINLSLISDEYINLKIPNKNEEIESMIKEEISNNNIILKNSIKEKYLDIKINKNEKEDKEIDYIAEINAKDKLKKEIENKIKSCMEKEELLLKKQNELKKLGESINIDEKKLDKKLLSLTKINKEEYELMLNQLIEKILDYDNFIKDAKSLQKYLIKYRDSLIVSHFFKIIEKRVYKPLLYIADKNIIFLNNEKLLKMVNNLTLKAINKMAKEITDYIFEKISKKEIFINHKEEYEQNIKLYKEICHLYPILNFFENHNDKNIYEISKDLDLCLSENNFDNILRINSQIPNRSGLHITLDYFKKHSNLEKAYEISLRGTIIMYQKYKILFPNFKRSSFLYN